MLATLRIQAGSRRSRRSRAARPISLTRISWANIADNYRATAAALELIPAELVAVAENAARASFLPATAKAALLGRIRQVSVRA